MRTTIIVFLINILLGFCVAEEIEVLLMEDGIQPASATIQDVSWMSGYWEGEGFGGKVVQIIAPPSGSQMMGAFHAQSANGDTTMYQFYTFLEKDETVVLRMKHFSSDFKGWEDKSEYAEFRLVAIEDRALYFDRLSFVETEPGRLEAAVDFKNGGIQRFYYNKILLPPS